MSADQAASAQPGPAAPPPDRPAGPLEARVVRSLRGYTDAQLDRVTSDSGVFLGRRWLRMIEVLDLAELVRGAVDLRYAVVHRGEELCAVCPFLITRSSSVLFAYSFRKAFFTGWQEELLRVRPELAETVKWVTRLLTGYRYLARAIGVRTDAWVLAVSPLSFRGGIAVAPGSPDERRRARLAALGALKDTAAREGLPLCLFAVPEEDAGTREAAREADMQEIFLTHDNYIELTGPGMEDYLARFKHRQRGHIKKEIEKVRKAGVRFEVTHDPAPHEGRLAEMYEATYSKFGEEYFAHPGPFWATLGRHLGEQVDFILAFREEELLGFSVLFDDGDPMMYRVGKPQSEDSSHLYFNLTFYEPIRRAAQRGRKRIWVGPGALETKHHRGAVAHPLLGYFWFPSRRSRALLSPYLETFTRYTREQLEFARKPNASMKSSG